jgi:hypothetical protein
MKGLQAAGHNVSAAAIIQLKVSRLIKINWHETSHNAFSQNCKKKRGEFSPPYSHAISEQSQLSTRWHGEKNFAVTRSHIYYPPKALAYCSRVEKCARQYIQIK